MQREGFVFVYCICVFCRALNHGCGQRAMKARMACAPPATRHRRAHTHAHTQTSKDWVLTAKRRCPVPNAMRTVRRATGEAAAAGSGRGGGRRRGGWWWWSGRSEKEACGGRRKRRRGCPVVFVIPRRDGTASVGVTMGADGTASKRASDACGGRGQRVMTSTLGARRAKG